MLKSSMELVVASLAGFLSHWTFFVHGERDLAAAKIARLYILAVVLIPLTKCILGGLTNPASHHGESSY